MARAWTPSSASGPVAVHPSAQIALDQTADPETFGHVDQQAQVDAVAADERDRLQDVAPGRAFSGERLGQPASSGKKSEISGRAISSVTRPPSPGPAVEGALVVTLDKGHVISREERSEQAAARSRRRSRWMSASQKATRSPEVTWTRPPHGLALAVLGAVLGQDVGGADHGGAGRLRHRGGVVGRPVVHDDQLVDHGVAQSISSRWMVSTVAPTVAPSFRAGRQTDTRRPRLAATRRAAG